MRLPEKRGIFKESRNREEDEEPNLEDLDDNNLIGVLEVDFVTRGNVLDERRGQHIARDLVVQPLAKIDFKL